MNYEIETTILINDTERPATIEFDYTPAEPEASDCPGEPEKLEITACRIVILYLGVIDLITSEYIWLISTEIYNGLKQDAFEFIRLEEETREQELAEYLRNKRELQYEK